MPSFSDSFWSNGYSSGLTILFDKLRQGCVENEEVLALASARAEAEEAYGRRLQELPTAFSVRKTGFGRDDGASLRRAYEGIISEMGDEGQNHLQVADNIRRMVIVPFGKWADEHRQRVDYSNGVLKSKLKSYEKELTEVQKSQKRYFNKCRVFEDYKDGSEDENGAEQQPIEQSQSSPPQSAAPPPPVEEDGSDSVQQSEAAALAIEEQNATMSDMDDPVELGEEIYSPDEAQALFKRMLGEIPQKSIKIAILGTYEHVSTGDEIVSWGINNGLAKSVAEAERLGQSLVNTGYLRLVGQVGSKFANSSVMNFQWRKKAFAQAGMAVHESSSLVGGYFGDTINNYINNPHSDETLEERLKREVLDLDLRYKGSVSKLDDLRCALEEAVIDHLKFMDRCEYDRLKAVKAVFLDFLATLSNVVPSIQSAVDKQLLFQETIHPANDLRYILESYQTGSFSPKVTVYDNYYNSTDSQTFGVDIELRCRGDRKRVPYIVSAILHHMDGQYPDLENDDVRLGVWTVSVPLNSTHRLRKEVNTGQLFSREVLHNYEAPIVASVLKLYLVELPDSLVPSQFYDIIKTIYAQHGNDEDPRPRVSALQNTLSQMRLSNIATLDAILTHLTRLTSITSADPEYLKKLAHEFSHCILRPRTQSSLTIGDRHAFRLVYDLLTLKNQIFSELKRNNSQTKSSRQNSTASRDATNNDSPPPSSSSEKIDRRASLQNRLDALSLKIRKGNNNKTKQLDGSVDESESPEELNEEAVEQNQEPVAEELKAVSNSAARRNLSLTGGDVEIKQESAEDDPPAKPAEGDDSGAEHKPIVID